MFKKLMLTFLLVISLMFAGEIYAVNYQDANVTITINDEVQTFDVSPVIVDGRTLVPLRAIFEALGADLAWEGSTQTITGNKDGKVIILKVGQTQATIDGQQTELDVPALLINERTFVPTRFIAESLGVEVGWYGSTRTIAITTEGNYAKLKSAEGVYRIDYEVLGKETITKERILEISTNLELLQEEINTVADVVLFLRTLGFESRSGDTHVIDGNIRWHFNIPSSLSLEMKRVNCGGISNLVNYLLKGDYGEAGYLVYTEQKGGHVTNFFRHEEKYYTFDFLTYLSNDVRSIYLIDDFVSYAKFDKTMVGRENIKTFSKVYTDGDFIIGDISKEVMYFPTNHKVDTFYNISGKKEVFIDPIKFPTEWNME